MFNSDNYSGVHDEVIAAIAAANSGPARAYGDDSLTSHVLPPIIARHFGERARAYPVWNGTGANVVALASVSQRWGAVICGADAHINTDENAAPERIAGVKLLPVSSADGKLRPRDIAANVADPGDVHRAQPGVVSISQATELGTVYRPHEIAELADAAHCAGMLLHVDGARLANAAASLGVGLAALTTDAGVDIVSLGGTKNGALAAEAVVVLNPDCAPGIEYVRKLTAQVASKMRFLSAQLVALYDGDLWLRNARAANAAAARLRSRLDSAIADGHAPGLSFTQPTEANAIFARLPTDVIAPLQSEFGFYQWRPADKGVGEVRWMCSFDTTDAEVDAFAAAIIAALSH